MLNGHDLDAPKTLIASIGISAQFQNIESQLAQSRYLKDEIARERRRLNGIRGDWNNTSIDSQQLELDAKEREIDKEILAIKAERKGIHLEFCKSLYKKLSPQINSVANRAYTTPLYQVKHDLDWLAQIDAEFSKKGFPENLRLGQPPRDISNVIDWLETIANRTGGLKTIAPPALTTSAHRAVL